MTKHPSFLLLKTSRLLIERYLSPSRSSSKKNKWFVSMHRMCRLRSPGIETKARCVRLARGETFLNNVHSRETLGGDPCVLVSKSLNMDPIKEKNRPSRLLSTS